MPTTPSLTDLTATDEGLLRDSGGGADSSAKLANTGATPPPAPLSAAPQPSLTPPAPLGIDPLPGRFTVDENSDIDDGNYAAGHLSLREAVALVNLSLSQDNEISFASGLKNATITLALGELVLTNAALINGDVDGDGKGDVTIDAGGNSRIATFDTTWTYPDSPGHNGFAYMTLTGGNGMGADANGKGGAVYNKAGYTGFYYTTIIGNTATTGGAIYNKAAILVASSLLTGNSATGMFGAGAIHSEGSDFEMVNATVYGNTSGYSIIYSKNELYVSIDSSTITGNTGGTIVDIHGAQDGVIYNTLFAGNTIQAPEDFGTDATSNSNLTVKNSVFGTNIGSLVGGVDGNQEGVSATDLHLGTLADNGGPVQTLAILDGASILVDAGDSSLLPPGTNYDATGRDRIYGSATDVGAYEFQPLPPLEIVVTTKDDTVANDGLTSLREAVALANGSATGAQITFDGTLAGETIVLSGELELSADVTIDGDIGTDNKADITLSGGNANRVFRISGSETDVTLLSLTLANGIASGANNGFGGAIIALGKSLTVKDTTIRDSYVGAYDNTFKGGGIYSTGDLTIINSLLTGNKSYKGAALYEKTGEATIIQTTVTGNTGNYNLIGVKNAEGLTLTNSTVTGNLMINQFTVSVLNSNHINIANSVIADNNGTDSDVRDPLAITTHNISNSVFGTSVNGVYTGTFGNIAEVIPNDLLLGPLADNGGTVKTIAITDGASILVDAGDSNAVPQGLQFDANGETRVSGSTVDIGAVEFQQTPVNLQPVIDITSFTVNEGDSYVGPFKATDPEGAFVTYGITQTGDDDALFTINPITGALSFVAPVDFENPSDLNKDNDYEVSLSAFDGTNTATAVIHVSVSDKAETITVTTEDDVVDTNDGEISFREAVAMANMGGAKDTIAFDTSLDGKTILLTGGEIALTCDIAIDGDTDDDGKANVTISAGGQSRIFNVSGGADVTLNSLTLTGGSASGGNGGAILQDQGSLTLHDTTIESSEAQRGGAISTSGTLTAVNSLFYDNHADRGAAIDSTGSVTLDQVTATGNSGNIGPFSIIEVSNATSLDVTNATIAGNFSLTGLYIKQVQSVSVDNSIIAQNGAIHDIYVKSPVSGTVSITYSALGSVSANFATDGTLGNHAGNSDAELALGTLSDNGGTVQTLAITSGTSVLVDAGKDSAVPQGLSTDAAGQTRITGNAVDIGAYEFQPPPPPPLVVTTADDVVDANDGVLSLREALTLANQNGGAETITFDQAVDQQTIILTSELTISDDVTIDGDIDGDDINDFYISGDDVTRIFKITNGADVTMESLYLYDGRVATGNGAGIYVEQGSLTLQNSTLNSNYADKGGGIYSKGDLSLINSTISKNFAATSGAAIYSTGNTSLDQTTIANNNGSFAVTVKGGPGLTMTSSTVYSNDGDATIITDGVQTVKIYNSAVLGNNGIYDFAFSQAANSDPITIKNSAFGAVYGSYVTDGVDGNMLGVSAEDAGFHDLSSNGGPVKTVAIESPYSVLINAGSNALGTGVVATDAAGQIRNFGGTVDIGAFEYQGQAQVRPPLVVTTLDDTVDGGDGVLSLREAITAANKTKFAETITFDQSLKDNWLIIDQGQFTITKNVTIDADVDGDDRADVTFSTEDNSRLFYVDNGASLTLKSIDVEDTSAGVGDGGAIYVSQGTLAIEDSEFRGTFTQGTGGVIFSNGDVTVRNSMMSGIAVNGAGAIYSKGALSIIQSSLLYSVGATTIHSKDASALTITNSTITRNLADVSVIYADWTSGVSISNSVVADNTANLDLGISSPPAGTTGAINNSAFGSVSGYVTDGVDGNMVGVVKADLGFGDLFHNGGPVRTLGIEASNSILINAGSNALVPNGITEDGAGQTRVFGGTVDIGAYEFQSAPSNNHAPTLTSDSVSVNEEQSSGDSLPGDDVDGDQLTYAIIGGPDRDIFTIDPDTGAITFKAEPDYEHPADSNQNNVYVIRVSVFDGTDTIKRDFSITVQNTQENRAPVINSPSSFSVDEGNTAVDTVDATDADSNPLTYSLSGGADKDLFTIDSSGQLSFKAAPDFETPADSNGNNAYRVEVSVFDGKATTTQMITVTVNDAADVITVTTKDDVVDANDGVLSLREAVALANAGGAADRIEFDSSLAGRTIALTGGDLELTNSFTIDGDIDGDDKADVTVSGSDLSRVFKITGSTTEGEIRSLTITHGREVNASGGAIYLDQGKLLLRDSTVSDSFGKFSGGVHANGGELTVLNSTFSGLTTRSGAAAVYGSGSVKLTQTTITECGGDVIVGVQQANRFAMTNSTVSGNMAMAVVAAYSAQAVRITNSAIAGNAVYAFDVYATNSGTVTVSHSTIGSINNGYATDGVNGNHVGVMPWQLGLGALQDNGGPVSTLSITDGSSILIDGGDSTAVPLNVTEDANGDPRIQGSAVDIGAVEAPVSSNHAPVFTTTLLPVSENRTAVGSVVATDADLDGVSYSIIGGPDQALFTINAAGALRFISAPDFENPADALGLNTYQVLVRAWDGHASAVQLIEVSVLNANESGGGGGGGGGGSGGSGGPSLTPHFAATSFTVHNGLTTAGLLKVTDADGNPLDLRLTKGGDNGLFTLDPDTGLLRFKAAPDFDAPADRNGDNVYVLRLKVGNGADAVVQTITVTVEDGPKPIAVTSLSDTVDPDDGVTSLREAIIEAGKTKGPHVITFDTSVKGQTITLTEGALELKGNITIIGDVDGDGAADVTFSGGGVSRIFDIAGGRTNVTLSSLTLTDGLAIDDPVYGQSGGAVLLREGASLTLTDSTVQNSHAVDGGGIFADGTLKMSSALLTGNGASRHGGGVAVGSHGQVNFIDSTFTLNEAETSGGGLAVDALAALTAGHVTIVNNDAGLTGGGISVTGTGGSSTGRGGTPAIGGIVVANSIIADNNAVHHRDVAAAAGAINASHAMFGSDVAGVTDGVAGNAEMINDLGLGELLHNGGTTLTMALLDGSVLIDKGALKLVRDLTDIDGDGNRREWLELDGRGGWRVVGPASDIGAVEYTRDETITGTDGANRIIGGKGDDVLDGAAGRDRLRGGSGDDVFVLHLRAKDADRILDFDGAADVIAFHAEELGRGWKPGVLRERDFAVDAGADSGAAFTYQSETGRLYYDADGTGSGHARLIATLHGAPALTAADILIL